jgi:hypothetical protein
VQTTLFRGALALSIVVATVVAIAAAGGHSTATAADPQGPSPRAELLHPSGFGRVDVDVRHIPRVNPGGGEGRPEPKNPDGVLPGGPSVSDPATQSEALAASAPTSGSNFAGLSKNPWGAGWPPDPSGDVGPNHYVQTVNTSIGIYDKSNGALISANTFDGLFGAAKTGTPCDNDNQGDPVTLYDPFGDRFIVTDFAWTNYSTGPFYQCMAVSKTGDPVGGGWWFYAWKVENGAFLPDYPKLGVWPDGIYLSANVFASSGSGAFQYVKVMAFNREQMEAGNPNAQAVSFNLPKTVGGVTLFSLLPSNARAVTGAPPAGSPNLFASIWGTYAVRVWKFHVDWASPASSTFTGPTNVGVSTFNVGPGTVPESGGNALDTLSYRVMMQNQYTNVGGRESLWLTHTVGSGGTPNIARVRWYEIPVTGGTISSPRQQSTFGPDSLHRFMPSLAVDRNGDMAVGYSVSSSGMRPAIRFAGRLAGDALNQITQTETTLVQGLGFQCCSFSDGSTNNRWGDYSAMTIDPDGCTFWYTGEYYDDQPTTLAQDNWRTRIGSFTLPGCGGAVVAPSILGFSPTSGSAGTSVTITGSGFTGASSVTFNGTPASYTVNGASQITATVPAGATTGTIGVTTSGGTASSADTFEVTAAPATPSITSFSPTSGSVGAAVTINGSNLGGATTVAFNGTAAAFTVISGTQLRATVPAGATSGAVSVTTPDGTATSSGSFAVVVPGPTISGFSPTSGPIGTLVTINGTGFAGATSVVFKNRSAVFSVVSNTQITATVPTATKTGRITVQTPGGSAQSAANFTVTK